MFPGNDYFQIISRQLLLSPLLLPVFRLEHQRLYRHGGREGGNVRGGEWQQQGRPSSQHSDSFHLGQAPGPPGLGGGAGVGGGVERHHVLPALELQQRLRPAHLQVGLGRRGHLVLAGDGERQRLLGGRARSLPQHRLQLQPAELAGVRSGAGHCPHSASAGSGKDRINISSTSELEV